MYFKEYLSILLFSKVIRFLFHTGTNPPLTGFCSTFCKSGFCKSGFRAMRIINADLRQQVNTNAYNPEGKLNSM